MDIIELITIVAPQGVSAGFGITLAIVFIRIVRQAYVDSSEQYRLSAVNANDMVGELRGHLESIQVRLIDMATQLGNCKAESAMARQRATSLETRLIDLEKQLKGKLNGE